MLGEILRSEFAEDIKRLEQLLPLDNAWTPETHLDDGSVHRDDSNVLGHLSKQRRYTISPEDMLQAQRQARALSLSIIGVYHSHPDHVAVPSECDRTLAWPDYAYLIASVKSGKTVDIQTWALDSDHQFQTEAMRVTSAADPSRSSASI